MKFRRKLKNKVVYCLLFNTILPLIQVALDFPCIQYLNFQIASRLRTDSERITVIPEEAPSMSTSSGMTAEVLM